MQATQARAGRQVVPFASRAPAARTCRRGLVCRSHGAHGETEAARQQDEQLPRRALLLAGAAVLGAAAAPGASRAEVAALEPMEPLRGKDYGKTRISYSDYTRTPSGLQYQDFKVGTGAQPKPGQTAIIDWAGFTIGYYGRPFEARNKPKGGAFTGDEKEFYRFKLGANAVIPGVEEAVAGMKVGGIRRIVVPVELGYPDNEFGKIGPVPSTFSGKRALDFVLKNQGLIDKTLLFDIELVKVLD